MDEKKELNDLQHFGLTRQDAVIYLVLAEGGDFTGYEVAKTTGISRSNVYSALSGLKDKGAAYVKQGATTKYRAVSIKEFCENHITMLKNEAEYLNQHIKIGKNTTEGYLTIEGSRNIHNKIRQMMCDCEKRMYLLMNSQDLKKLEPLLSETIRRGIKTVILTDKGYAPEGAVLYETQVEKNQIRFITDSSLVLTGELSESDNDTCLYSGQENLVTLLKEALKNKITLIKEREGNEG